MKRGEEDEFRPSEALWGVGERCRWVREMGEESGEYGGGGGDETERECDKLSSRQKRHPAHLEELSARRQTANFP